MDFFIIIRNIFIVPLQNFYNMETRDLIYIIVALLVAVAIVTVFFWLLPFIVVLIIAYVIYIFLKDGSQQKGKIN
ncbi:MAG: hypothetical protein CIT03_03570 [Methanobacterium sp.]|nr:MAG: hypothetical protein CIT03_03570 [Methanobacterium sp.]